MDNIYILSKTGGVVAVEGGRFPKGRACPRALPKPGRFPRRGHFIVKGGTTNEKTVFGLPAGPVFAGVLRSGGHGEK